MDNNKRYITGREALSRTECSALRGFAILGIFLHNYLHWLNPMVKENEYLFSQDNVDRLVSILASPSWDVLLQLFSFFGHYGVPVFLFLSGYGLVMKYESDDSKEIGTGEFLKKHFMKLFPMMMLGFTVFAMVDWITPMRHHWAWTDIIAQLTMTINIFPYPDKIIWPGPYWFFGLMMQLYLIYIAVLYKRSNRILIGLIALCWAIQALCFAAPEGDALNSIRYNSIGGMLPFGMGILLARSLRFPFMSRSRSIMALAVSLVVIVMFSLGFQAWLWVPAFIVVFNVALIKLLPSVLLNGLSWLGVLSSAIFVCHPITRKIFIPISRGGDIMDGLVLYIVTTIVLAIIFRKAMRA